MIAADAIKEIQRLQSRAWALHKEAVDCLVQADALAAKLREASGRQFVCNGESWKLENRARQICPGNRDWLEPDRDVKVLSPSVSLEV